MAEIAPVTQFATLRKQTHLTTGEFREYWSDVHGPAVSQLPGIHEYVQHHLRHDTGQWWPQIRDVSRHLDGPEQLDGAPEVIFTSAVAREKWVTLADGIQADEINAFSSMKHQLVLPGNAIDFVRRDDELDDDHELRTFKLLIFLVPRSSPTELRECLREVVAPSFATVPLRMVRLSLLDEPEMSSWQPTGVSVDADSINYSACLELEWTDYRSARQFYGSDAFGVIAAAISEHAQHLNAYRVDASYRFVRDGTMTLAGAYGVSRARVIRDVGAVNH